MEFKAIIDAKARNAADCAVMGVYEDGDLGAAAAGIDFRPYWPTNRALNVLFTFTAPDSTCSGPVVA